MGGVPGAIGNAASAVGSGIGDAAKSFWGAGKEALNENYIQPWKDAASDFRGNPQAPSAPGAAPGQAPPAATTGDGAAMKSFFNAPAVETPAMRLRRMQQQQA